MTKKKAIIFTTLATIISTTLLTGCSGVGSKTAGDRIIIQSSNTKEIGKRWNEGYNLVKKGEKQKKEGQKLIENGRELTEKGNGKVVEGDDLIARGQKIVEESEALYKQRFPNGKSLN